MKNELYQLVAFDKNNIEYIIELNNDNKKNKGTLEFIDSGTVQFSDSEKLAEYLFNNGKIPTKDVTFSIKYLYKENRYLPLIFNNRELYNVLMSKDFTVYNDFMYVVLRKVEVELNNKHFYKYLVEKNFNNMKIKNNGNYFSLNLSKKFNEYYVDYVLTNDIDSNRADIQCKILNELRNYKQLRTVYMFYLDFIKNKDKIIESQLFEKYKLDFPVPEKYEHMPDIPEDIYEAYRHGGMDEVYSIADGDDIFDKGIKFK